MASRYLALALMLLLLVAPGSAQNVNISEDAFYLGGFDLWLGMDQQAVLKKLGTVYDVEPSDMKNTWTVFKRSRVRFVVGLLTFAHGNLVGVTKVWGPDADHDQSASAMSKALYNGVRAMPSSLTGSCALSVQTFEGAEQTVIQCGNRTFFVTSGTDPNRFESNVTETITRRR